MVLWVVLILAFIAVAGGILYQLAKARGQVMGAVEKGVKEARFQE